MKDGKPVLSIGEIVNPFYKLKLADSYVSLYGTVRGVKNIQKNLRILQDIAMHFFCVCVRCPSLSEGKGNLMSVKSVFLNLEAVVVSSGKHHISSFLKT